MIPRIGWQPDEERLDVVALLDQLRFYDIVDAETDPRYRAMLKFAIPGDGDSTRGEKMLAATLDRLWRTPVSHPE